MNVILPGINVKSARNRVGENGVDLLGHALIRTTEKKYVRARRQVLKNITLNQWSYRHLDQFEFDNFDEKQTLHRPQNGNKYWRRYRTIKTYSRFMKRHFYHE